MELCKAGAHIFSTCTRRQYMAILVDYENHVLGMGYNGVPSRMKHCSDGGCPRALQDDIEHGKSYDDCLSVHAESNALLHSNYTSRPSALYVNGPPCWDCAKLIANSTIKYVFYLTDQAYKDFQKVMDLFKKANVALICLGEADASE